MVVDPVIANSARRHGVADDDMLHAYRNTIEVYELDEGLRMLVGADRAGRLLEIGVDIKGDADRIVHAMPRRRKYTR
jgi:hypothetical protein